MRLGLAVVLFVLLLATGLGVAAARAADPAPTIAVSAGDWWIYVSETGRGTATVWSYTVASVDEDAFVVARTQVRDGAATEQPTITLQRSALATPKGLYLHVMGKDGARLTWTEEGPKDETLMLGETTLACQRYELTASLPGKGSPTSATLWTSAEIKTGPRLVKLDASRGKRPYTVTLAGYGTKTGATWGTRTPEIPKRGD